MTKTRKLGIKKIGILALCALLLAGGTAMAHHVLTSPEVTIEVLDDGTVQASVTFEDGMEVPGSITVSLDEDGNVVSYSFEETAGDELLDRILAELGEDAIVQSNFSADEYGNVEWEIEYSLDGGITWNVWTETAE